MMARWLGVCCRVWFGGRWGSRAGPGESRVWNEAPQGRQDVFRSPLCHIHVLVWVHRGHQVLEPSLVELSVKVGRQTSEYLQQSAASRALAHAG